MQKFYLALWICVSVWGSAFGQIDTEFWFAPPEITKGHGDRPVYIRVSSQEQAANVRIVQPARGNAELANFTIAPNTTQTVDLTNHLDVDLETNLADSVMKTGLRIVSTAPITAYYEEASFFNAEIFVLKGRNAMGNRFVIPWQTAYDNATDYTPSPYASFDIVATEDYTLVQIYPTRPIAGHESDSVITVRLNAGETFSCKKPSALASMNPVGTIVTSSKPIAITIKDDSVFKTGGCRDLLGDQLIPSKVAGKEYIVPRGFLDRPEFIFIVATEDDTDVYVAGVSVPVARLSTGQMHQVELNIGAVYVRATRKVYVLHVTGFGCEVGMSVLPPVTCTGSKNIAFTRSTDEFFGMNILVKKAGIYSFKLNGNGKDINVAPALFHEVPGTIGEWYSAQISYSTDEIPVGVASVISNPGYSFQAGIINGNAATSCRYGYFSSYSTLFIGDDVTLCRGDSIILNAGAGKESYTWSTGEHTQSIEVSTPGDYWVSVVKEDCALTDTVHVGVVDGVEDLGPDIELCEGDTVRIDGKPNFRWMWSDGSSGRYLETALTGTYWIEVSDNHGCAASDTIEVRRYISSFDPRTDIVLSNVSVDTTASDLIHSTWSVVNGELLPENRASLFRRLRGSSSWDFLGTFLQNIHAFPDSSKDTDSNVYEYYLSLADKCGREYRTTAIHNTILLSGYADTVRDEIILQWNHYFDWPEGVDHYELWRKLDGSTHYRLVSTVSSTNESFKADFAGDGFKHQYVIRALEKDGRGESWSNPVDFEFQHVIVVPNVFTPNDDSYNQHFFIPKIELYTNSRLTVIDRWGVTVYESSHYKNDWDGSGLSSGVYYYVLKLGKDDEVIKGIVSVIR